MARQKNNALIILSENEQSELSRKVIQISPKQQWVRLNFNSPLPPGPHSLVVKTDPETTLGSAILIHYQPDSRRYEKGNMIVNGNNSYGDIAFRLNEKLPLWKAIIAWGRISNKSITQNLSAIITAFFLPLFYVLTYKFKNNIKPILIYTLPPLALILLAVLLNAPLTQLIEGVFGGDAFNYLSKTEALLNFEDFFAADPRKGPFLSLLALPGFMTADPLLWSRWLGIFAAAGTVTLISFVGKYFRLPWALALSTGLLLTLNQDFIWEAPNGMANTLFAFMITVSLLTYFYALDWHRQLLLSIFLGLTFLTRYEGILFILIILPALFIKEKINWKKALLLIGITIAICVSPQISYFWSGHAGIRTISDINNDGGLSLVYSKEVLTQNFDMMKYILWNTWIYSEQFGYPLYSLLGGLLAGALLLWRDRKSTRQKIVPGLLLGVPAFLIVLTLVLSISLPARAVTAVLPLFLCGVGVPFLFKNKPFDTSVILLVIFSQLIFITLIIPKSRYYLPIIPFMAMFMVAGIYFFWKQNNNRLSVLFSLSVIGLLAGFLYVDGHNSLMSRLEKYNNRAQDTSVMIQAVKYLRSQYGIIAFRTNDEQSIQIYIPRERRKFFSTKGEENIAQQELSWIRSNDIKYLVERNRPENWQITAQFPDVFERLHTYDTIYGDSRVIIYTVHRDKLNQITQK